MKGSKTKILVCVEGAKTDVALMHKLLKIYHIDAQYEIVSYNTNIYTLYHAMFSDGTPEDMDLLQILKEREKDESKRNIFDIKYSDILLIFDMDPQDPQYSSDKLFEMSEYFNQSTDQGKLYLNYPMVEAFYHMTAIPDDGYNERKVAYTELTSHKYKQRVNAENRNHDYTKFAITREECSMVIKQNIEKVYYMLNNNLGLSELFNSFSDILQKQVSLLESEHNIFVLCTCAFFIAEYNSILLESPV